MKGYADVIVVNDIPSIVSKAERIGQEGAELESIELIGKTMLKIKSGCVKKGITIIWINQVRADDIQGLRIWGGNYITSKMQMTLMCEARSTISRGGFLKGSEIGVSVFKARSEYVRRSTHIGVFLDGSINYPYWIFQEAQRYRIIVYKLVEGKVARHGFVYGGKVYRDRWKLIDKIENDEKFRNELLGRIDGEEKRKSLY